MVKRNNFKMEGKKMFICINNFEIPVLSDFMEKDDILKLKKLKGVVAQAENIDSFKIPYRSERFASIYLDRGIVISCVAVCGFNFCDALEGVRIFESDKLNLLYDKLKEEKLYFEQPWSYCSDSRVVEVKEYDLNTFRDHAISEYKNPQIKSGGGYMVRVVTDSLFFPFFEHNFNDRQRGQFKGLIFQARGVSKEEMKDVFKKKRRALSQTVTDEGCAFFVPHENFLLAIKEKEGEFSPEILRITGNDFQSRAIDKGVYLSLTDVVEVII